MIFTSMRDNQGGDTDGTATAAATGDWNYVNLSATAVSDSCVFTNCEFRYGGNNGSAGMLMISAATPRIENSYIYESQTAGIYIIGANPQVVGCRFADNYRALDIRGRATAPGITGNQIEPQDNTPVIIDARCVPDIVSNNTFTARLDGKLNAIQLWETTIGTSMTWPVPPPGFVYLYSTNDGYSNPRPIVIGGTGSPVLTLLPGTIVKLYEEACLQVGNTGAPGGLKANGVIFTSMRDNQGGDTDGTATAAATGDWNYVNLSATAVSDSCVFTNCEFRYGGNNGSAGMLMISAATPRIENSYIYESQTAGIYIIGANPQVVGCRFADNYRALDIRGRATAPGITGNQIEPQDNTPVIIDARCVPDIVSNNTFTARLDGKLNAIQLWGDDDRYVDDLAGTAAGLRVPLLHK
ncbi:MAG: right-handed parallel beta-helix repeat-containing protein [Ahniella sp.]|nr:right-handed parallel beta-helix repeat-containing protein [Ahniella sp.]